MKKRFAVAMLVTVLSYSAITSCNARKPFAELAPTDLSNVDWGKFKQAGNKTKINFWGTFESNWSSYNRIKRAFEDAYPGIQVEYTQQASYPDLFEAIKKAIPANNTPTMAYCYPDHVATYLSQANAAENMAPYMENDKEGFGRNDLTVNIDGQSVQLHTDRDDIVANYLEEGHKFVIDKVVCKGYYSLPWSKSTEVLFYNKKMLAKAGMEVADLATWEGVWRFADALLVDPDFTGHPPYEKDGQKPVPMAYDSDDNLFITNEAQLGIPYTNAKLDMPLTFGESGKEGTHKMLAFMQDKFEKGAIVTRASNPGRDSTNPTSRGTVGSFYFKDEVAAMVITSTANTSEFERDNPNVDDIGIAPYPISAKDWSNNGADLNPAAQNSAVMSQGPSMTIFRNVSLDQRAAAWLFYKFATSDYMSSLWSAGGLDSHEPGEIPHGGYAPIRNSSFALPPLQKVGGLTKPVLDLMQSYGPANRFYISDVFVGSSDARMAVSNLLSGLFLSHDTSAKNIDDFIQTAFENAAKGLKK